MAFTGKATYDGGTSTTLTEVAEDLAPDVAILAQRITPLLDLIGDPMRPAMSTHIEWLEDGLNAYSDTVPTAATTGATSFSVSVPTAFRDGDVVMVDGSDERMLVTSTTASQITVTRGYGGSTKEAIAASATIRIIGDAALEGDSAPATRFQDKTRVSNYTQIFVETVDVSDSNEAAARAAGYASEHDYQVARRLEELLRRLEAAVIRGIKPSSSVVGSDSVRRTMQGISRFIEADTSAINTDKSSAALTEDALNDHLRQVWDNGGRPNVLLVGSIQKRRISSWIQPYQQYGADASRVSRMVGFYESDFGVQRVILSPWMQTDSVLALDTSLIEVKPLVGRSFQAIRLAKTGDNTKSLIRGEYTCCVKNPAAHGRLYNLSVS